MHDEELHTRLEQGRGQFRRVLRAHANSGGDTGVANLRHGLGEKTAVEGRGVQLLQMTYCRIRIGIAGGDGGQLLELGVDVTMTSPQPLTVDDAQRAELAELDRHRRRHQRIGRVTQDRGLEPVGIDLPRGGDVLGGTGPT